MRSLDSHPEAAEGGQDSRSELEIADSLTLTAMGLTRCVALSSKIRACIVYGILALETGNELLGRGKPVFFAIIATSRVQLGGRLATSGIAA